MTSNKKISFLKLIFEIKKKKLIGIIKMDIKQLNTKSYAINSKYKKHTGPKIRYSQKSRSNIFCKEDKANRKWRIYAKREVNHHKKQELKSDIKNQNFNCCQKIVKSKRVQIDEW